MHFTTYPCNTDLYPFENDKFKNSKVVGNVVNVVSVAIVIDEPLKFQKLRKPSQFRITQHVRCFLMSRERLFENLLKGRFCKLNIHVHKYGCLYRFHCWPCCKLQKQQNWLVGRIKHGSATPTIISYSMHTVNYFLAGPVLWCILPGLVEGHVTHNNSACSCPFNLS